MRYSGLRSFSIVVCVAAVSIGCANTNMENSVAEEPVDAMFEIEYRFDDYPAESRIEITYKNETDRTVCLLPTNWPNLAGRLHQAGKRVSLVIEGERLPIRDYNRGSCLEADGCALHVDPGEEVSASIPYADFSIPEDLVLKDKKLIFIPRASYCRTEG